MVLFSKKNALILALAVCFSLYQFNKHHQKASRASGTYQLGSAKRLIMHALDPWKYELVQGKNKHDDEVLLVLRRENAGAEASRAGTDRTPSGGSISAKQRPSVAPIIVAEVVADKRMARANQRRARDPRARAERSRRERRKSRERRAGRSGSKRKKGGRLPWRHGSDTDLGGRGSGRGAAGGRRRGGRRGRVGDDEFYLDAPPALRMEVYDSSLNQLKLMLAKRGLIDKNSVADLVVEGTDGEKKGMGIGQRGNGAHAMATGRADAHSRGKSSKKMTAEQLTKEIMESEEAKRKALAAKRVEEEGAKRSEEGRKRKEETRKAAKKRQKDGEEDTVLEVAPDGSAAEL